jgi:hypothetical protein
MSTQRPDYARLAGALPLQSTRPVRRVAEIRSCSLRQKDRGLTAKSVEMLRLLPPVAHADLGKRA